MRELCSSDDGVVGVVKLVVDLIPFSQPLQDLYRLIYRRLGHLHRLEPPLQSRILLYVLPIFIKSRRSNALQRIQFPITPSGFKCVLGGR